MGWSSAAGRNLSIIAIAVCFASVGALRPPLARAYEMSDVVSVPPRFVSDFRRTFPTAIVDDPDCNSFETSTACKIDFKLLSSSGRPLLGGCTTMFYARVGNGVLENVYCSAVGPADGTLTKAEHDDLSAIRTRLIAIVIGRTGERLSPADQASLTARIDRGEPVNEGEWTYSADEQGNIMGADASRGFDTVKSEFDRRFSGR